MDVAVIGSGRWGTFLAWYLNKLGHRVALCGRPGSHNARRLAQTRGNGLVTLPPGVQMESGYAPARACEVVLISVPSQNLRALMQELPGWGVRDKLFVLCMKGLEMETGKRLSEVVAEEAWQVSRAAVWLGPGHVQEFTQGVPNCMVIDAACEADKRRLVEAFGSDLIRFYYGEDLVGNEVGAAAKNVVGIAAGMLDGFGLASLKGALMSRATREYARLIKALGGSELSAYGLCHLGDYEATVFSPHSHNRHYGEAFVRGETFDKLAEGYYTAGALCVLARKTGVELPITSAVYQVLYQNVPPSQALDELFARSLKQEFA